MRFMRYRKFYFLFSGLLLSISLLSLLINGLRPAIDFTGGSLLEVEGELIAQVDTNAITQSVQEIYQVSRVQSSQDKGVLLRGEEIDNEVKQLALAKLRELDPTLEERRFETIGPTFGREVFIKMMGAVVMVSISILLYIWYQFKNLKFGLAAVLAMFHDSILVIGFFSLLGYFFAVEVDILFITAVLTTLAFSVHDTIVVFDRIRELSRKHRKLEFPEVVDVAVLETLGRSVNNSVTVILMLLALTLLGGETIRWFVAALLVGVMTGTYSSPFLAAPLLITIDEIRAWWLARKK